MTQVRRHDFTCKYLPPEARVSEISWICGWLTAVGQIAGLASTEYGIAKLILAAVSMNMDFSYLPTTNQTVGAMTAIMIFHGVLNSMSTKWLETLTRTYVVFHVAVLVTALNATGIPRVEESTWDLVVNIEVVEGFEPKTSEDSNPVVTETIGEKAYLDEET